MMKKSLCRFNTRFFGLLLSCLLFGTTLQAQVLHSESFDGTAFPPAGWMQSGANQTYLFRSTAGINPVQTPHSGAGELEFNSYNLFSGATLLVSPVVDWSNLTGTDTAYISFWFYRDANPVYNTPTYAGEGVSVYVNTAPTDTGAQPLGYVSRDLAGIPTVTTAGWYFYSFQVPTTFNTNTNYFIFHFNSLDGDNCFMDDISWVSFPHPCTGTPNPGNIIASVNPVCNSQAFTLSLQNSISDAGISLQWQSSPDSANWTILAGDTLSTFTGTISDSTFFRVIVHCSLSGLSDTTAIKISLSPITSCYCTPGPSSCTFNDVITNVYFAGIADTTACSTNGYSQYNLTATVQRLVSYPISVTVGNGGTENTGAWIDFNQNGIFEPSEFTAIGSGPGGVTFSNNIAIPNSALLGLTRMRIRDRYGLAISDTDACTTFFDGETEDYLVNILVAPPCTTPPVGGIASGPDSVAIGGQYLYKDSAFTGSIQWQISTTSATGPFFNIPGAYGDTLQPVFDSAGTYWLRALLSNPGCLPDSSNAVRTVVIFHGDNVCDAVALHFGWNGPFSTVSATVQPGEPAPPSTGCQTQTGWCNSFLYNTLWFTFNAPASGRVSIHTVGFDTKLAVWSAATCDTILHGGANLVAANDDDPNYFFHGDNFGTSWIDSIICLTPGLTYYVQMSASFSPGDTTSVVLTDMGPGPGPTFALAPGYCITASPVYLFSSAPVGVFAGPGVSNSGFFPLFYPDSAGVGGPYVITFTVNNCVARDTVYVGDTPVITLVDTTGIRCHGDSTGSVKIHVTGGTGFTYLWSTNQRNTDSISGLPWGYYSVIVKDLGGCSAIATYILTDPATSVSVSSVVNNQVQGSTGSITQTVAGGVPPYKYKWSTGDSSQSLLNVPAGVYTFTVTDAAGCVKVKADTIRFISGIRELDAMAVVSIFPNPSPNNVFVTVELNQASDVLIEVYDMNGRMVTNAEAKNVLSNTFDINLENEASGVYMAKIRLGGTVVTRRIVVSR